MGRDAALFGPGTVTWRVNREPVVFMGGGRALLLQVAHPLVGAGVEQHSTYKTEPWRRLHRTLTTVLKIAFGDRETSERAAARLRRRHDYVKGQSEEGVPYDAQDPELLLWVWATLVDTSLVLYERCLGPLGTADRDRFYEEQKRFAYACGVPEGACPHRHGDFRQYFEQILAGELRVTRAGRDVADSIVRPPVPAPLRPLFTPGALVTAGLLPPALREQYGFRWGPRRERRLAAFLGVARAASRVAPRPLRTLPVALASR
jgi:uncharacterized protein (DUF2236 family)